MSKSASKRKAGARFCFREKEALRDRPVKEYLLEIATKVSKKFHIYGMETSDLISECLIKMFVNLEKIRWAENPPETAYEIAKNHLINLYNRERKSGYIPISQIQSRSDAEKEEFLHKVPVQLFWQSREADDMLESLYKALSFLPSREYMVIQWMYGLDEEEEMKANQIAKMLNISTVWVYELRGRAFTKLRTMLELAK